MRGLGTIVNVATITAGGLAGVYVGHLLPEQMRRTIMQGLGLVVMAVAVVGFEPLQDPDHGLGRFIVMIVSILVGAVVGELLRLEARLEGLGDRLRRRFDRGGEGARFIDGFVVASMVFATGPLTILGALEDGLGISARLLFIKSALDGVAAVAFAAVYGWGVLAALLTIVVVQGGISVCAVFLEPVLTGEVLAQLGATGSLLILGIAFRLLDLVRIPIVNLLPAIPIAMAVAGIAERY